MKYILYIAGILSGLIISLTCYLIFPYEVGISPPRGSSSVIETTVSIIISSDSEPYSITWNSSPTHKEHAIKRNKHVLSIAPEQPFEIVFPSTMSRFQIYSIIRELQIPKKNITLLSVSADPASQNFILE
ncbi:MAG: hypothetical protein AAF571_07760 [Verrucomicrobiota bacterium]